MTYFQLREIREEYYKSGEPPDAVISEFLRELRGIYRTNPRTSAYFNSAAEIARSFALEGAEELNINRIHSVARSQVPRDRIITVLERGRVIDRNGDVVKPGELTESILRIRWEKISQNSPEWERAIQEVYGLLTVTLTITLIELEGSNMPRSALAIFHLISEHIIATESQDKDEIDPVIPGFRVNGSFSGVSSSTTAKLQEDVLGFSSDGQPKLVENVDENGNWITKEITREYMNRIWNRWRERDLDRDREVVLER